MRRAAPVRHNSQAGSGGGVGLVPQNRAIGSSWNAIRPPATRWPRESRRVSVGVEGGGGAGPARDDPNEEDAEKDKRPLHTARAREFEAGSILVTCPLVRRSEAGSITCPLVRIPTVYLCACPRLTQPFFARSCSLRARAGRFPSPFHPLPSRPPEACSRRCHHPRGWAVCVLRGPVRLSEGKEIVLQVGGHPLRLQRADLSAPPRPWMGCSREGPRPP